MFLMKTKLSNSLICYKITFHRPKNCVIQTEQLIKGIFVLMQTKLQIKGLLVFKASCIIYF